MGAQALGGNHGSDDGPASAGAFPDVTLDVL